MWRTQRARLNVRLSGPEADHLIEQSCIGFIFVSGEPLSVYGDNEKGGDEDNGSPKSCRVGIDGFSLTPTSLGVRNVARDMDVDIGSSILRLATTTSTGETR